MKMIYLFVSALLCTSLHAAGTFVPKPPRNVKPNSTFCNPLDLNYRFQTENKLAREAADPVMIYYKGDYYLFASKSGGYWYSNDMTGWTLVGGAELPLEAYAPAVFEYKNELYFMASGAGKLFKTADPKTAGSWKYVADVRGDVDPALFCDDDGRVYLYYGCQPVGPIRGVELDPANAFKEIGAPVDCLRADYLNRGWEVRGDTNTGAGPKDNPEVKPWVEGAWMTKHDGKYYLQYAAPGTEFVCYADGAYISDSPLGPFTYCDYSPVSVCPTGFAPGAGHGCVFTDAANHYWSIMTGVLSVRAGFERRLNLLATGFDGDGQMFTATYLSDLPQYLPGQNPDPEKGNLVGWMLLSYNKSAEASSTQEQYPIRQAFDENIKTYWSAKTGDRGEWLKVDLMEKCTINAVQINFAEEATEGNWQVRNDPQKYVVEISRDGTDWQTLIDASSGDRDRPHTYVQLEEPVKARFVKVTNVYTPFGGRFAIRDLRLFGKAAGKAPRRVEGLAVTRDPQDGRAATLTWQPAADRDGVIIRYGIAPDKLNNSYLVRQADTLTIHSLTNGLTYYFAADAVSATGLTQGKQITPCPK